MEEKLNLKRKPAAAKEAKPKVHAMKYWTIADLEFLYDNPRQITEAELDKLQASIKSNPHFFEARPALISNRTGLNVIIAGNQRVKAAIRNGSRKVPAVLMEGLTEAQEREIAIKDNVNSGEWDTETLARAWGDLPLEEWIGLGKDIEEQPEHKAPSITKFELSAVYQTHVLLSFAPELMAQIQPHLQAIADIEGVEYEQTSN